MSKKVSKGVSILVVDGSAAEGEIVEFVLGVGGYDVQVVGSTLLALALVPDVRPRVMLVDLQLLGPDADSLVRRIKSDPNLRGIVVVGVIDRSAHILDPNGLTGSCDGYLRRPLDARTLPDAVARFLDRPDNWRRADA